MPAGRPGLPKQTARRRWPTSALLGLASLLGGAAACELGGEPGAPPAAIEAALPVSAAERSAASAPAATPATQRPIALAPALIAALARRVSERTVAGNDTVEILPFQTANPARAQFLLTGTTARVPAGPAKGPLPINPVLTELKAATG